MTPAIRLLTSAVAVAASLLLVTAHEATQAQSAKTDQQVKANDLNEFLCKDIVRMSGDDRIIATSVLHGYTLGRKGTTKYVPVELGKVTDSFIEHCLSSPNDNALQAFTKLAK